MESTVLITQDALDALSYRSAFGKSLKQISLQKLPLEAILEDVAQYRQRYIDALISEGLVGSRFKSDDSIWRKYEKTLRADGGFRQCCNDILGFRLHLEAYPDEFPDYFRVVDLRKGNRQMTDIGPSTCTISGTTAPIPSSSSSGAARTISSTSGATGTCTNIIPPRWAGRCIRHTAPECSPQNRPFWQG